MISHPAALALFSFGLCGILARLAKAPAFKPFFAVVPTVIFVFFVPTAFRTIGLIPATSSYYDFTTRYLFPAALLLFIASADVKLVMRMGRPAALSFASGAVSIIVATPILFSLFDPIATTDGWKGVAVMASAFVGGFPNMLAVNESVGCDESLFGSMVMATSVLIYSWMWLLIACRPLARPFDRYVKADADFLKEVHIESHNAAASCPRRSTLALLCGASVCVSAILMAIGRWLPTVDPVLTGTTWGMLLLLAAGLAIAASGAVKSYQRPLGEIGLFGLYVVLSTIGAKANFANLGEVPRILAFGAILIGIHFLITLGIAVWLRYPFVLAVTASMANIGGVLSAPVVASAYDRRMAISGVLMGLLGSISGTPIGFLVAQLVASLSE